MKTVKIILAISAAATYFFLFTALHDFINFVNPIRNDMTMTIITIGIMLFLILGAFFFGDNWTALLVVLLVLPWAFVIFASSFLSPFIRPLQSIF